MVGAGPQLAAIFLVVKERRSPPRTLAVQERRARWDGVCDDVLARGWAWLVARVAAVRDVHCVRPS